MKHWLIAVGLVSVSICQPEPPQTFRATSHAVTLDVSVLDRDRPVVGLQSSDFQVLDNGVEQTALQVSRETLPLDVSLLLDISGSVRLRAGNGLARALVAVRPLLPPSDRVELWPFSVALYDARGDGFGLPWSWAAARYGGFQPDRGTALFDATLAAALRQPAAGFRRMLIVFSDNQDQASFLPRTVRRSILARLDTVVQVAAYSYFTAAASGGPTGGRAFGDSDLLYELADLTGGFVFPLDTTSDPAALVKKSLDEFRSRYVVRYESAAPKSGWHEVRVRVRGKNYDIKARQGYEVR
jgi:hypothetical protein